MAACGSWPVYSPTHCRRQRSRASRCCVSTRSSIAQRAMCSKRSTTGSRPAARSSSTIMVGSPPAAKQSTCSAASAASRRRCIGLTGQLSNGARMARALPSSLLHLHRLDLPGEEQGAFLHRVARPLRLLAEAPALVLCVWSWLVLVVLVLVLAAVF